MIQRIIGVLRLDPRVYEDIEHDLGATNQALIVVAVVALLSAIGSGIGSGSGRFGAGFLGSFVWAFIGWLLWSLVSYLVGTAFFGGRGTMSGMLRVIGFAQAPLVLSIIPCIGALIGGIWALITGFVAVRQGLDLDNLRAFLTILVGFIVYVIGAAIVGLFIGGTLAFLHIFG